MGTGIHLQDQADKKWLLLAVPDHEDKGTILLHNIRKLLNQQHVKRHKRCILSNTTVRTSNLEACLMSVQNILKFQNTGQFISPSRISDLSGTVAEMVMSKGSTSTEGERHFRFLSYLTGARYVNPW
jgi:hypothetical protein